MERGKEKVKEAEEAEIKEPLDIVRGLEENVRPDPDPDREEGGGGQ